MQLQVLSHAKRTHPTTNSQPVFSQQRAFITANSANARVTQANKPLEAEV